MLHKKTITKSPFSTTPQNRRHQNPKTNTNQSPNATKPIRTAQRHTNTNPAHKIIKNRHIDTTSRHKKNNKQIYNPDTNVDTQNHNTKKVMRASVSQ